MSEEKKTPSIFIDNLAVLTSPEGFQKYVLGTKKNGSPRAIYDIVKDYQKPKKKKNKKDKKKKGTSYSFYLTSKKKKKKKNKNEHWHI